MSPFIIASQNQATPQATTAGSQPVGCSARPVSSLHVKPPPVLP
jgi:hypothetical protein